MRIIVTGSSRGIGLATAKIFAQKQKCVISMISRSHNKPSHKSLQGTLVEAAKQINNYGSNAFAIQADLRKPDELKSALKTAMDKMGGLDVLINNASALSLRDKDTKLLFDVNVRGTLTCLQTCNSELEKNRGSIVTLSPPIDITRHDWIRAHPAYTTSKYAMTIATLGYSSQLVRSNCLWPRHTVATAATERLENDLGFQYVYSKGRHLNDTAYAVYKLATSDKNGECLFDDEVVDLPQTRAPYDAFVNYD